ncbi:MAG: PAS domain-containing protein [Alphaproteobacteria bacterium]
MLPQPRPATEPELHARLLADFPRVTGGLRSPATRGVLAYWRALVPGAGGVPHRRAVDPIGIGGRLLPHIFLCEYAADGRILIRLQGSYLAEQAGQTMTGRHIDQSTFGVNAPAILRLYETVRATRCPLATHETVLTTRHDVIPCEVLHLPLLRDAPGTSGATEIGYVLGALDRLDDGLLPRHALQAKEVESIHVVDGI